MIKPSAEQANAMLNGAETPDDIALLMRGSMFYIAFIYNGEDEGDEGSAMVFAVSRQDADEIVKAFSTPP